ncbi:MAG: biopolymer transporter ExbD [Prevotella sp.]|nr:biopolymer transporter ExbD [Prevotella sp.]
MIKRRIHTVPSLNMASMPDLIFTVLFFFIIVSHMRTSSPKVDVQMPQGSQLTQLDTHQSQALYLYIGEGKLQVNNRVVGFSQLPTVLLQEQQKARETDSRPMVVYLKADKQTPVSTILQVKQMLRQAHLSRIVYGASEQKL